MAEPLERVCAGILWVMDGPTWPASGLLREARRSRQYLDEVSEQQQGTAGACWVGTKRMEEMSGRVPRRRESGGAKTWKNKQPHWRLPDITGRYPMRREAGRVPSP